MKSAAVDPHKKADLKQFSTFYIADRLYGIDVKQVQEVTQPLAVTSIRLAKPYVMGLINLRGQIATAIGIHEIFGLQSTQENKLSVVSRTDGVLLSLLVDRIGDVIEVSEMEAEASPATIPVSIRRFMSGVYKLPDSILSVIDMNKLVQFLYE